MDLEELKIPDEVSYQSRKQKITLDSFMMLTVIGMGSYAKVILVKKKDDGKIFALKILKKKRLVRKKQKEHIKTERLVLANMNHPFIVKMKYAFQTKDKLYFALTYCPGGELFNLLAKKRRFSED